MSKKKKPIVWLLLTLLAIGVAITLVLAIFVKSSRTYIDVEHFGQIICTSIGAESTTSTEYGFPLTFLTTYENSCTDFPPKWQPLNLAANVGFFGAVAFGILYLRRKIR